jgi:hypothetical protein
MAQQVWWDIAQAYMRQCAPDDHDLVVRAVEPFIREQCVTCRGAYTSVEFAYRQYSAGTRFPVTQEQFLSILAEHGWREDESGMLVDLCLSEDFLRAVELGKAELM